MMHQIVLKDCADVIAPYIAIIFTKSLEHGIVPEDWKLKNFVPIHKSGPRNNMESYRPTSLTSQCYKLMEHIIYTNLTSHITKKHFFTPYQHGSEQGSPALLNS